MQKEMTKAKALACAAELIQDCVGTQPAHAIAAHAALAQALIDLANAIGPGHILIWDHIRVGATAQLTEI